MNCLVAAPDPDSHAARVATEEQRKTALVKHLALNFRAREAWAAW
jgi:hypothetical protein